MGRLAYVEVIRPVERVMPGGKTSLRYSTTHCYPRGADLGFLQNIVDAKAKERFGVDYRKKYPKLKTPFFQTSDYPAMRIDPEEFPTFIRTSSNASDRYPPPKIFDWLGEKIGEDRASLVYSGRWAILAVNTFGYDVDGNKGVSFGLQGLQLREDGERLGGGGLGSDAFEAVPISESADALFGGL
jgi:hypothetical protein